MSTLNTKCLLNARKLLHGKYADQIGDYNQMHVDILIHSVKSHYFTMYKDYLLWDYIEDFLKRFYQTKTSMRQLPRMALYYKNYSTFFCRPLLRNFAFAALLQRYADNQAEVFYKQAYGKRHSKPNDNNTSNGRIDDIEVEETVRKHQEAKGEPNSEARTILNTSARNFIDNNYITTINLPTTQSDNQELLFLEPNTQEEFFTIGTHNDFFIELLSNFSYKSDKRPNCNGFPLLSRVIKTGLSSKQMKTEKNDSTKQSTLKQPKSYQPEIDKIKSIPHKTLLDSSRKKAALAFHSNTSSQLLLKYISSSKFSDYKMTQPKSKSKSQKSSKASKSSNANKLNKKQLPASSHKSILFKSNLSIKPKSTSKTKTKTKAVSSFHSKDKEKKDTHKAKSFHKAPNGFPKHLNTPNLLRIDFSQKMTHYITDNKDNRSKSKVKCDKYLSVKSLVLEDPIPFHLKPEPKQSNAHKNHHSHYNITTNKVIMNTCSNLNSKHSLKAKHVDLLIQKVNLHPQPQRVYKANVRLNLDINRLQSQKPPTTATSPNQRDSRCRNKSHLNLFNDKIGNTHHSIKMNLSSNGIISEIFAKKARTNKRSLKQKDSSSQTTSNTHKGNHISKSPKGLKHKKRRAISELTSNSNSQSTSKAILSEKQSRRPSPGNLVSIFFSQRK